MKNNLRELRQHTLSLLTSKRGKCTMKYLLSRSPKGPEVFLARPMTLMDFKLGKLGLILTIRRAIKEKIILIKKMTIPPKHLLLNRTILRHHTKRTIIILKNKEDIHQGLSNLKQGPLEGRVTRSTKDTDTTPPPTIQIHFLLTLIEMLYLNLD